MRETKFRARMKNRDFWISGGYYKHLSYTPAPLGRTEPKESDYQHLMITSGFSDWMMPRDYEVYEIDPETLCESTGLKDKNGVTIYENDIVVKRSLTKPKNDFSDNRPFLVHWSSHRTGWNVINPISRGHSYSYEIIGNIYNNPELLKTTV